ncbi:hypothetical protein niasHT_002609 [Heterodera trifolii]|uniref:Uncharacterized protein n=1 Tax=Heterodera trifolii TaxID=157864 RepID=A0ABD2M0I3_9BILA
MGRNGRAKARGADGTDWRRHAERTGRTGECDGTAPRTQPRVLCLAIAFVAFLLAPALRSAAREFGRHLAGTLSAKREGSTGPASSTAIVVDGTASLQIMDRHKSVKKSSSPSSIVTCKYGSGQQIVAAADAHVADVDEYALELIEEAAKADGTARKHNAITFGMGQKRTARHAARHKNITPQLLPQHQKTQITHSIDRSSSIHSPPFVLL